MSLYLNRYISQDLFRVVMLVGCIGGVFMTTLAMNDTSHHGDHRCHWTAEYKFIFNLGLLIAYISVAVLQFQGAYFEERSWRFSFVVGIFLLVASVLCAFQMIFSETNIYAREIINLLDILLLGNFGPVFTWMTQGKQLMVHIGHMSARLGIYVMITLGESVIQLLHETLTLNPDDSWQVWRHSGFSFGAFLVCVGLALEYFDTQPHDIEENVFHKSLPRARFTVLAHIGLYFTLFLVGVALKILLYFYVNEAAAHEEPHHEPDKEHHRLSAQRQLAASVPIDWTEKEVQWLLAVSLSLSAFFILVIRQLHSGLATLDTRRRKVRFLFRILLSLSFLVTPLFNATTGNFLRIVILLNFPGLLLDLRGAEGGYSRRSAHFMAHSDTHSRHSHTSSTSDHGGRESVVSAQKSFDNASSSQISVELKNQLA